jgi:hypothetical protein
VQRAVGRIAGETPQFPSHVGLVGVFGISGQLSKIPMRAWLGGKMQKALKTEHGLE